MYVFKYYNTDFVNLYKLITAKEGRLDYLGDKSVKENKFLMETSTDLHISLHCLYSRTLHTIIPVNANYTLLLMLQVSRSYKRK